MIHIKKYKPDLIAIVGNQRSGTSLIARLFDGHREVLSLPGETNFFTQLGIRREIIDAKQHFFHLVGRPFDYGAGIKQRLGIHIDRDKNWQPNALWDSVRVVSSDIERDEKELEESIRNGVCRDTFYRLSEVYARYFWTFTSPPEYVLEKTPGNEFCLDTIFSIFPRAKILHVVRDPFDVIESILKGKDKKTRDNRLLNYIYVWKSSLLYGLKHIRRYPDNYCFVKFENLLGKPEQTMRGLSRFLGVEFNSDLLRPTDQCGRKRWESHTHQNIKVESGMIDKRLHDKDAAYELGEEFMRIIGGLTGPEYRLFGWRKYGEYIDNYPVNMLRRSYPGKNLENTFKYSIKYLLSLRVCFVKDFRCF